MRLPLTIVFSVESHLASAVSRNLFDRSELQIELPAWDIAQTEEFFAWSFHRLGRSQPIFTQAALERIQQLSEGIVRRMVQLADLSLVAGAVAQLEAIDEECVDQVAWELPKSVAA
jgi:type II secretory pathway predicted ATPase ExeA